jgi:asparagine synthase (glutamine-hydrolysing)
MFKPEEPLPGLFSAELAHHISKARSTYESLVESHPVTFAVFRQAPWYHYALFALEGTQLTVRSPYLDNELVRTAYRFPKDAYTDSNVCLRLIADGDAAMSQIRTDRGEGKAGVLGAMSRGLFEFSFKAEYAYNHGMPQWLARVDHALSPFHLERAFLGRHKYAHFRVWYRDCLSKYVQDMLLDSRTLERWFIDRNTLQRVVAKHVTGMGNYTFEIHKVLTLELLHRSLLDRR